MNRFTGILLSAAIALGCLSGCGANGPTADISPAQTTPAQSGDKIKIVTTIFPEYDWVRQILGEKANDTELTLLLDNGVDLHSYQPTAEDILNISNCDMFIYVGGESDEWVEDALAEATNKDMKVINLMEVMGDAAKTEEVKEGMEPEEDEEHEHEHEDEDEAEYDEHVWLSVKNAKVFCEKITEELCEIDPENSEIYKADLSDYAQQLDKLDSDFTTLASDAENKTLIFGDRFPFRYFTDDYGFDYYAAFVGCSAETEASFETVAFLSDKMDTLGNKTIFTIESSDQKIAQAITSNTKNKDQNIAVLDSMQSTTSKQAEEGTTYLSVMQKNYDVLKDALK